MTETREVLGGEAVFDGILRDAGFAIGGDRAGGELGVGAVGGDLGNGGHEMSFRTPG